MQKEGKKNDRYDDKTRWELMPLDCLEDIARVYTEGAKKYGDNNWQYLEDGYNRYKGALLRHLYQSDKEVFDKETGCRHLAQVAWNAIAMLYLSKKSIEEKPNPDPLNKFVNDIMGDQKCEADWSNEVYCYSYNGECDYDELMHEFVKQEEQRTYHVNRKEAGQDTMESGSDVDVSTTDIEGHKS